MKNIKKCEICGGKKFDFLFEQKDKNFGVEGKYNLNKCDECGVIFLNPQPEKKDFQENYPEKKYYSLQKINRSSRKTRLKIFLYEVYFNPNKKNLFLKIIFSPIKFIVRGTKISFGKKLLDIGCGSGQFLYEMKKLGMQVQGIEPGNFEEEDLNIKKGNLKSAKFGEESFDIITTNHVLEHLNNPRETLKEVKRTLKKDGLFIVGVPNYSSLAYWIFGKNWYQIDVPRHLFNYSENILRKILKKEGFKIIKVRYNSRPSQFVVSLEYFLNRKFGKFVKTFLSLAFLPLTWAVNLLKIGDQIEVWCEKYE